MKKLAIVSGSLSRGGAERVSLSLARYISQKGFDVTLITSTRANQEYLIPEGIKRINLDDNICSNNRLIRLLRIVLNMRSVLSANQVDTVLVMGVPLCLFAVPGCFGKKVNLVVSERNDPTHFEGKRIVLYISRALMRKAKGYVYQTHEAQDFYSNIMKSEGVVIPNPLPTENLCAPFEGEREKTIISAGRLIPQKNQLLLIEAFDEIRLQYPEYKLIIYGDGYLKKNFEELIHKKGLEEKVLLPGNIPNLSEKMRTAGIFVLPSNFEGMPNALIEALALGIPCISTDCPCGGPRDLITNGENGLLVPVGDKDAMVGSIIKLITDKICYEHLGNNAINIRKELDIVTIGDKWINYLESIY